MDTQLPLLGGTLDCRLLSVKQFIEVCRELTLKQKTVRKRSRNPLTLPLIIFYGLSFYAFDFSRLKNFTLPRNITFHTCTFFDCYFNKLKFYSVKFYSCRLSGSHFKQAKAYDLEFNQCYLNEVNLTGIAGELRIFNCNTEEIVVESADTSQFIVLGDERNFMKYGCLADHHRVSDLTFPSHSNPNRHK